MPQKIDKITWGKIKVDNKEFHDILISGDKVEERDYPKLEEFFGTSHEIGKWEVDKLFENEPQVILIGTGWAGVVNVPNVIKEDAQKKNLEYLEYKSKKAVKEYNKLVAKGLKVNALIHSTC